MQLLNQDPVPGGLSQEVGVSDGPVLSALLFLKRSHLFLSAQGQAVSCLKRNTKFRDFPVSRGSQVSPSVAREWGFAQAPAAGSFFLRGSSAAERSPGSHWKLKMATAAATSASEAEAEPKAGPTAEGEEDEAKAARTRRKVLSRAVDAATYKAVGPGWDQQEEGVSESDGDEEYAMASSAESSPGEYEWEYDEEEEKNQLEIERLEEQVCPWLGGGLLPSTSQAPTRLPGPRRQ